MRGFLDMVNEGQLIRCRAENGKLCDAIRSVIAHYDEHGARTRGMDMILNDCRKLLEEMDA